MPNTPDTNRKTETRRERTKTWKEIQFSVWDGSHIKTVQHLKDRMHDPKSYSHVETKYIDYAKDGYRLIYLTYRGSNLFGAILKNITIVKVNLQGDIMEVIQ